MDGFRWLSTGLVVALLLVGPLASVTWAQQPRPQEETMKAPAPPARESDTSGFYKTGAVIATAVNIPLRGLLCGISVGVGFVTMLITFGSGYRTATWIVAEGCRGPWILTADDLKGPPEVEPTSRY